MEQIFGIDIDIFQKYFKKSWFRNVYYFKYDSEPWGEKRRILIKDNRVISQYRESFNYWLYNFDSVTLWQYDGEVDNKYIKKIVEGIENKKKVIAELKSAHVRAKDILKNNKIIYSTEDRGKLSIVEKEVKKELTG